MQTIGWAGTALASLGLALSATPAWSQAKSGTDYRNVISNNLSACAPGNGTGTMITITNISQSKGKLRIQAYRGVKSDWLEGGKWLNRIEVPARSGTMRVCMPLPGPGTYAIAVRHDLNGNGKTDLTEDGGGMSNNPSINLFNLGKPSYTKTRYTVGDRANSITIQMRYM
ncbi:DUF2141 domain-containing protein [Altererythrobacter aurantiacus]|uniref:DUF2141 domain-containing protein n=2 Tax=Parapontixanthobacter aurantiacus TaxID=1463599 RepID=A0A844ZGE2_9SPHN|nr:DUF2141 domain-containing protein [Parapontixanthobacter aurantiacus]